IINQIDKHNEKELSFHMFDTSVEQTLEQWGLSPEKIYYSSLLQEDAPFNQFHEIKEKITDLFNERLLRIDASVQYIVDAHKQFLTEKYEEAINELAMDGEVDGSLLEKIKAIQAALA